MKVAGGKSRHSQTKKQCIYAGINKIAVRIFPPSIILIRLLRAFSIT